MRRIVTVGGIVVTAMLAGSIAAAAEPRAGSCPARRTGWLCGPGRARGRSTRLPSGTPDRARGGRTWCPSGAPGARRACGPRRIQRTHPGRVARSRRRHRPGCHAVPLRPVRFLRCRSPWTRPPVLGPRSLGLRPVRYLRCRSRWTRPPVLGPRSLHLRPPLTRPSWGRRQACLPPTLRLLRWAPGRQCLRHQLRLCLRLRPMPGRRCLHPHPQLIRRVPSPPGLRQGPGRLRPTLRLLRGRLGRRSATPRPPQARRTQRPCSRFRARSARCRSP